MHILECNPHACKSEMSSLLNGSVSTGEHIGYL